MSKLRHCYWQLSSGLHSHCPGTPYARRFHEPGGACACEGCSQSGRQLHAEPLFLDCCGLVRRVMRRMRRLLGFRFGPGNQAYQVGQVALGISTTALMRRLLGFRLGQGNQAYQVGIGRLLPKPDGGGISLGVGDAQKPHPFEGP